MSLVREHREKAGMTLVELATRIGLDASALSRGERGQRKFTVDEISRIAHALRCKPSVLIPSFPTPEEMTAHV